jgi:hypothetical protein
VRIAPLVERPDLAAQVAAWGFAEWGHLNPGQTLDQRVIRIQGKMNVDRVPIAFVALDDDGGIVGTASLIFDDLEGDPRNPCKKGIASALVQTVEDAARRLGYTRLYLFTSTAPKLYADLGWRPLEQRDYRGDHIQIMDKTL